MQILYLLYTFGILIPSLSSTFDEYEFSNWNFSDFPLSDFSLRRPENGVRDIFQLQPYIVPLPVQDMIYDYPEYTNFYEGDFGNEVYNPFYSFIHFFSYYGYLYFETIPTVLQDQEFVNSKNPEQGILEEKFSKNNHSIQEKENDNKHQLNSTSKVSTPQNTTKSVKQASIQEKDSQKEHRLNSTSKVSTPQNTTKSIKQASIQEKDSHKEHRLKTVSKLSVTPANTGSIQRAIISRKENRNTMEVNDEEYHLIKRKNETNQDFKTSNSEEKNLQIVRLFENTDSEHQKNPLSELSGSQTSVKSIQDHSVQEKETSIEHQLNSTSELSGYQNSTESIQEKSIQAKEDLHSMLVKDEEYQLTSRKNETTHISDLSPSSYYIFYSPKLRTTMSTQKPPVQAKEDISNM